MYREQYERKCPTCGEQISATAPRCFNCGEYVNDEDDDDDDEEEVDSYPRLTVGMILGLVAGLGFLGIVVYALMGSLPGRGRGGATPAEADAEGIYRMMDRQVKELHHQLGIQKGPSPMTWAEVEPQLRKEMTHQELVRVVAAKDSPPLSVTPFGNVPTVGGENADETAEIIFLKDAVLVVRLDRERRLTSWVKRPAPE